MEQVINTQIYKFTA